MWQVLVQPITGLVKQFMENRKQKRELKQTIHLKRIENVRLGKVTEAEWNLESIKQSKWRAGYLTVILSIPMIAVFGPESVAQQVQLGFTRLNDLPQFYREYIGVMVGSSFGVYAIADGARSVIAKHNLHKAYTLPPKEPNANSKKSDLS